MITTLLAHAGEQHRTMSEAVQHTVQSGSSINTSLIFWIVLLAGPFFIWLLTTGLKARASTKLLFISGFLIIYSIFSYQKPGVYSALALAIGFGIVLIQSMIGLSAQEQ